MSHVNEIYATISQMELHQLHARKAEILASVNGQYSDLPDEPLAELCAITQAMRRKAATPGGGGKRKSTTPKAKPTLDDLA